MASPGLLMLFASVITCFAYVSSLECYSCFSYNSEKECENRHNLKLITCPEGYDTCMKFEIELKIAERIGNKNEQRKNKGFARYCGKSFECRQHDQLDTCLHTFRPWDAEVLKCHVKCCDKNITTSSCHKTPHWPGTDGSSNIITSNYTNVGKGARGSGALLTVPIWSPLLFILGALICILV